jgi:hypothetical protein
MTRMPEFSFPGEYEDRTGVEPVVWTIRPSDRYGQEARWFEIQATVRGVPIWGLDLDGLEPGAGAGGLALNSVGELDECVLSGDLPCTLEVDGVRRPGVVRFRLDLGKKTPVSRPDNLDLSVELDGETYTVTDEWFEDGLQRLEHAMPAGVRLVCCVTCQFSDYSPAGHGVLGMACHRGVKDQYLAARSKAAYFSVPVTEHVPETYLCPDYLRRVPGTGYRG